MAVSGLSEIESIPSPTSHSANSGKSEGAWPQMPIGLPARCAARIADSIMDFTAGLFSSKSLATELDWYTDWTLNDNFTVSFVAAFASPGKAVEQEFNRTDDFVYGMIYVAYSY